MNSANKLLTVEEIETILEKGLRLYPSLDIAKLNSLCHTALAALEEVAEFKDSNKSRHHKCLRCGAGPEWLQ